jgi:FAD dependent oxidoreductase
MNLFVAKFNMLILTGWLLLLPMPVAMAAEPVVFDLVVYGNTSAGIVAAVQAKKMGKSVIVVGPDRHLGGLSAGGLGFTDTGNKSVIGGLSREFYHRIWKQYQSPEAWRWQKQSQYGNVGQGTPAIDGEQRTMWIFEPHVAEAVFEEFVKDYKLPVERNEWLNRAPGKGVQRTAGRITSIAMESGKTFAGKMFIDATYEGDLLAAAGIDFHVGREANSVYGEKWNGIQIGVLHHAHFFKKPVDPYVIPGDAKSGLLPRVSAEPPGEKGAGDHRVQAYCYRMCLTNVEENRIPFAQPEGYDPKQYELLLRVFDTGWRELFHKFDPIPNHKTDTNNHGPFSFDNIGYNYDYPTASYERRREILAEHQLYQKGLLYFVANDPRVPEDVRSKMAKWGLPKDEFVDNGGWSHQIYVREARRMIGEYVMTEQDCLDTRETPRSVGMGSYTLDSHNVQRHVTSAGLVQNEGDIGVHPPRPYRVSYGSLIPKKSQCENLLVPVCLSSSHIAYGSIRMEPVFMILGQSAATAACLSLDGNVAVQDLPYEKLQAELLKDGQVLETTIPRKESTVFHIDAFKGVVVDDTTATIRATNGAAWKGSSVVHPYIQEGYRHDDNSAKGDLAIRFEAKLTPGRYTVRVAYNANDNRATNVPVEIFHKHGNETIKLNQKKTPDLKNLFATLGTFEFADSGAVVISNSQTDGFVVVDAVQFEPVEK